MAEDYKRSMEKLEETRRTSSVKTLHQEESPPFRCSGVASSTAARRQTTGGCPAISGATPILSLF